jgi:thymidine kinase
MAFGGAADFFPCLLFFLPLENFHQKPSQMVKMKPRIELWVGPMFASKTTMLLSSILSYTKAGKEVLLIKYSADDRYQSGDKCEVVTHDGLRRLAFAMSTLSDINEELLRRNDVIAIDEAHFFNDLTQCVKDWKDRLGKVILLSGLDKDFRRMPWSSINTIIPHCDEYHMMNSICVYCGNQAYYSKRLQNEQQMSTELVVIGGADKYAPVCEEHFI